MRWMENNCCLKLDNLEKECRAACVEARRALCNLRQVIGEFLFFDDEKTIFIRLNQPEVMKSLHKQAHPGPSRADHLGQFFMGYPELDANAARIFLAHGAGQL